MAFAAVFFYPFLSEVHIKTKHKFNFEMEKVMNKIIIREERKEDYKATEFVTMRAFWNIHGPGCNEHLLVHKMRNAKEYLPNISRVAELDGKIVGVIMYTKAYVYDNDTKHEVITFGPLAVEPTMQSFGIGGMLLRETLKLAKEEGYAGVCIFGEPEYYPKHGFVNCEQYGITDEQGNNYDALMAYELQEDGFANIKGKFKEGEIFGECEDEEEIETFTKQFPFYEKLKLKCQWLHKEKLGRICNIQKSTYTIQFWEEQLQAKLRGNFYKGDQKFPVVGDYVTFDYHADGDSIILELCERKSILKRPFPRDHAVKKVKEQEMVANVDYLFIVTSLNHDFSVNRVLRYIVMAKQGGVKPVVILTKSDLCENIEEFVKQMQTEVSDADIHVVSAKEGKGLEALRVYMEPGKTIALMGSSGVGKSTLINKLAGKDIMETSGIRQKDSKGRHTTTYRQMFLLDSGVTIIDTPGMRELGMGEIEEGLEETFTDIIELAGMCRFHDCKHITEPGCAVKKAIEEGSLSEKRLKQFMRLQKEGKNELFKK